MKHETFKIGTGAVYMHELADEFKQKIQADCLYLDPPSCYRQLKAAYTRANQPMPEQYDTYETYVKRLFQYVDYAQPRWLYIEAGIENKVLMASMCKKRYKNVELMECQSYYRGTRRCWIISCSNEDEPAPSPVPRNGRPWDTSTYIRWICKNADFNCVFSPVLSTGKIEFYAHKNGKKFISLCLNRKNAVKLRGRIDEYEKREAAKRSRQLKRELEKRGIIKEF